MQPGGNDYIGLGKIICFFTNCQSECVKLFSFGRLGLHLLAEALTCRESQVDSDTGFQPVGESFEIHQFFHRPEAGASQGKVSQ